MPSSSFASLRAKLERGKVDATDNAIILTFTGVEGYDVYNCSAPFKWKGKWHLYGRVEKREEVAASFSCVFVETDRDGEFALLEDPMRRQLEDPFVAVVDGGFVFGGMQVVKDVGSVSNRYSDLYRSPTPERPVYFSTGADGLQCVRVVQLADGRVGVFAQLPEGVAGGAGVGFTTVANLLEVRRETTAQVQPVTTAEGMDGSIGAVTHPYLLSSGRLGCLAQHTTAGSDGGGGSCATSFVYDPATNTASDFKILATADSFPPFPSKPGRPGADAAASGLVEREDGRWDLYVALGATSQGRVTVDYPYTGHGTIVSSLSF